MITAQKVKELRERTGVGMTKCKKALEESKGDIEAAIDHLRKTGIASAVKKGGREAKDGLIGFAQNDSHVAIVEVNSETDFVAKNDKFREFLDTISNEVLVAKTENIEEFSKAKYSKDAQLSIDEFRATIVQLLGENIIIKNIKLIDKSSDHSYGLYSHMGGKIVCAVELNQPQRDDLAKDVAMQVAAEAPDYLAPNDVPEEVVNHEKEIAKEQMKGKPENVIEKILEGKINSFYDQVCLVKQKFIKDSKLSVEQYLKNQSPELKVVSFVRWQIGE